MPFPDALDIFLRTPAAGGTPNKDIFESVWKIVQECGEEERHFNTLQSVYRGVASSWLLATFGAVGILLFDKDGHVAHPWLSGGICMLGALGICLLWMLDLHIYHRILEAAFDQALALEEKFPWLMQLRGTARRYTKAHVRQRLAWYYLFTSLAPAAVGVGLLYKYGYPCTALLFLVAWLVVVSILLAMTRKKDL
jgi:FtsH-binding integral membrane protein